MVWRWFADSCFICGLGCLANCMRSEAARPTGKGQPETAEQQGISLMGLSFLLSVLQMRQQFFAIGKADEGLHEGDGTSERGFDFAGG